MIDIIQVCDAVLTELNDHEFGSVNARRYYMPDFTLKDLEEMHVSVVPMTETDELANRRGDAYVDCSIGVCVQKRAVEADVSDMIGIVGEIKDYLRTRKLRDLGGDCMFLSIRTEPILVKEHLVQHGVFTSLIIVVYRTVRAAT